MRVTAAYHRLLLGNTQGHRNPTLTNSDTYMQSNLAYMRSAAFSCLSLLLDYQSTFFSQKKKTSNLPCMQGTVALCLSIKARRTI
jgi:hypothetical protein